MDEVVTKITNSVKNVNTGQSSVKISNIPPPAVKTPTMPKISVKSTDFMTFVKIFLIITILALLGFNVFTYLAKGTDMITYIVQEYGTWIPESIKKTLNLTEKGTKLGLDVTAGTVDSAVNVIEKTAGLKTQTPNKSTQKSTQKSAQNSQNLSRALNVGNNTMSSTSTADSVDSEIQKAKKPGWCYVGSDRKFRSCVKIGVNDQCMSGDIFPTKDICINPSLRE